MAMHGAFHVQTQTPAGGTPAGGAPATVLIVGAGPVGLLLANLLGCRGIPTRVFERRVGALDRSMAIGITPPSLEILRKLGLDRAFCRQGVAVRFAEVYEEQDRLGRLDFAGIESEYPFFLSLPQARTCEILRTELQRHACVRIESGVEFVGVQSDGDGVTARLRSLESELEFSLRGAFLVGCDGHRSAVRESAGIATRERVYPQRFVMADFVDRSDLGDEARLFFGPQASVESFPLPDGWRRWIVLVDGPPAPPDLDRLVRRVRQQTGYDLRRDEACHLSAFGARRMMARAYHAGRVVLAGDAAHVMSSIGGQGMNTGFADAELLAEMLARALPDPRLAPRLFESYDRVRRVACTAAATRAERGMWLGTLRGRAASVLRRHVIHGLLFSRLLRPRLAPHFAMLTIPFRNLEHVPASRLAIP